MSTLTSADGTTIGYDRSGEGPALILVDGALCYRGAGPMGPIAALLAQQFTVYTYDRRGRGESTDTTPYAIDREIDDLQALIDVAGGSAGVFGISSGALLGLHAAARGLAIPKLALFEPPLSGDLDVPAELAKLVAAGRRGDAVEHFQHSIGLPPEVVAQLRNAPFRPALEAIAHTLVYDTTIAATQPPVVATPTLVLDSESSHPGLRAWAQEATDLLPNARRHSLKGEFHNVPAADLAPVLAEFFR